MQERLEELSGKVIQLDTNCSNLWSKNLITNSGAIITENNDPCTLPKACKNKVEIQGMKNCHIRDAVAECEFLAWLDKEITEGNLHDEGILADQLNGLRAEQKIGRAHV